MFGQEDKLREMILLLLYRTSWKEPVVRGRSLRSWKNYPFDLMDELGKEELIYSSRRAKSVGLTEKGIKLAKELELKYLGEHNEVSRTSSERLKKPIYQFKISLKRIEPLIWRRIQVPGEVTLHKLCMVFLETMGWNVSHLHELIIRGQRYCVPGDDYEYSRGSIDERSANLNEVLFHENEKFTFDYDFGDGWEHEIVVEKIFPKKNHPAYPICLEGARACPPDDCGGTRGYQDFLEAISDSHHPEHERMLTWIGGSFDLEAFDIDSVNKTLKSILRRKSCYEVEEYC